MNLRPTWDEYFISICDAVAKRATCPRKSVGAVIVFNKHVIGTGYNGAPPGEAHCLDVGCLMIDDHCQRARHAEINGIRHALQEHTLMGATLYCNGGPPCPNCAWEAVKHGVEHFIYSGTYHDNSTVRMLERLGVRVESLKETTYGEPDNELRDQSQDIFRYRTGASTTGGPEESWKVPTHLRRPRSRKR